MQSQQRRSKKVKRKERRPKKPLLLQRQTAAAGTKRALPRRLISQILKRLLSALGSEERELSLLFVGDSEIRKLNAQYRKKNEATDVLSFPTVTFGRGKAVAPLGDLVISLDTA